MTNIWEEIASAPGKIIKSAENLFTPVKKTFYNSSFDDNSLIDYDLTLQKISAFPWTPSSVARFRSSLHSQLPPSIAS